MQTLQLTVFGTVAAFVQDAALRQIWRPIDQAGRKAFVGLHTITGALKGSHRNTVSLWSERDGPSACRATMNRERFLLIKRFFRTDDRNR